MKAWVGQYRGEEVDKNGGRDEALARPAVEDRRRAKLDAPRR